MNLLQLLLVLFLPVFGQGNRCGTAGNWVQYKDEKCYLLIDDFVTADDALNICLFENPSASLPVVKSPEEQQFIDDYIYVQHEVLDGVWLGATRVNSTQEFHWANGDDMTSYANWAPDYPSDESARACARMVSNFGKSIQAENGQWEDVACGTRNLVLCQKQTQYSLEEVVQELLSLRFNFGEYKQKTEIEIERVNQDLTDTKEKLNQIKIDMGEIIPVGFLYFQVGSQPSPVDLWPGYSWDDVSSTYEGLFFRVTGSGAAPIGTIQAENAPRLGGVKWSFSGTPYPPSISVPSSGWSDFVRAGYYVANTDHSEGVSFEMTNVGEVRPKNTAMRVWKRI